MLEMRMTNSTLDKSLVRNYLWQAIKESTTPLNFEQKWCVMSVTDSRALLPDDFVMLNKWGGVYLNPNGSAEEDESPFSNSQGGYAAPGAGAFPLGSPDGWNNLLNITLYQVIDNYIVFNTDADIEEVKISYLGLRTNELGEIVIPSSHERMLSTYCKAKIAESYYDVYPANLRNEWKTEYGRLKRYHNGQENLMTQQDREFLTIIMNRMVR
jgi:hypothetical protein